MRVRAAAGLHVLDVLRMRDVGDVEDTDAAHAHLAHCFRHALTAAVVATRLPFSRHEEQVLVDRDVALRRRAVVRGLELGLTRIRDVPHLVAVVVALNDVVADEGDIGVRDAGEPRRRRRVRDQAHVPRSFSGLHADDAARLAVDHHRVRDAGAESYARVGAGRSCRIARHRRRSARGRAIDVAWPRTR